MKSMTGYGSSEASAREGRITVEARSENHRFLDIRVQAPEHLGDIESLIHDIVKKHISRGKIKVTISTEDRKPNVPSFNRKAAEGYYSQLESLRKELNLEGGITLDHILMFKDLFEISNEKTLTKSSLRKIGTATRRAISNLEKSRKNEGKKLLADLGKRIKRCNSLLSRIKRKRATFTEESFERIKEKVENLLENHEADSARLYQEVAILAERSDITEEIVRLEAHLDQFAETIRKNGPVGKELDFLILEMNREASTISAKSKDADISHFTINLRSEFEKMREQVQNIE